MAGVRLSRTRTQHDTHSRTQCHTHTHTRTHAQGIVVFPPWRLHWTWSRQAWAHWRHAPCRRRRHSLRGGLSAPPTQLACCGGGQLQRHQRLSHSLQHRCCLWQRQRARPTKLRSMCQPPPHTRRRPWTLRPHRQWGHRRWRHRWSLVGAAHMPPQHLTHRCRAPCMMQPRVGVSRRWAWRV